MVRRAKRYDMLEAVIIVLLILAAITASAQPTGDGVPLLRQVSEAARSAKGWRAEGTSGTSSITVSTRGPLEMRYSVSGNSGSFNRTVCDGAEIWNAWYGGISSASGTGPATAPECNPSVLQWDSLLDSLLSAVLAGKDSTVGCALVRAEYASPTSSGYPNIPAYRLRPVTREVCVDEASKAILWERFFAGPYVVSLTRIERDPEFGPDEFKIPPHTLLAEIPVLDQLDALPLLSCSDSSQSVGCPQNPFALHDGN